MKKLRLILVAILVIISIVIGGYKIMQKIEHDKMVEIVNSKEAKKIYEEQLKFIDANALTDDGIIKSYQIDSFKRNPMGGIFVHLRINDNKNYEVTVDLGKQQDKIVGEGGSCSPELATLVKREISND